MACSLSAILTVGFVWGCCMLAILTVMCVCVYVCVLVRERENHIDSCLMISAHLPNFIGGRMNVAGFFFKYFFSLRHWALHLSCDQAPLDTFLANAQGVLKQRNRAFSLNSVGKTMHRQ